MNFVFIQFIISSSKTVSTPMASCVHNGNNETKIGLSQSIGITFSDNNGNEIEIKESSKLIDIWMNSELNN